MLDIFSALSNHVEYFPLVAILSLLLAALNLPISEDLIIITGAILSHEDSSNLLHNLAAIYFGVVAGDFLAYWVGTRVRKGAAKVSVFTKVIPESAMNKMRHYLDKYGIFTFIVGRFIPFGVRNTLCFSSGFFDLRLRKFIVYDLVSSLISVNTLFFLVYEFGEEMAKPIEIAGTVLFIAFALAIISFVVSLIVKWRRSKTAGPL
jgi:membrane protein DedA with SNARE-associated domain